MKAMIAEVVSIGDELTSGQRLDTNSQWLSQQLGDLGITVVYHTTVADDLAANELVFRQAIERADVVLATGGLGPTADDLTREALARVLGVELVVDEISLQHIRARFARARRDMPERNRLQALFPAGSRPIVNPHGTAPGIALDAARQGGGTCRIFALPGVPAEMVEMFQQSVAPALVAATDRPAVIRHRRIKCFGAGESHLEQMLPDVVRRGREPSVGITVHEATITLRVTAHGETVAQCEAAMEPTIATIRGCLGTLVFGEEEDELQDAVLRLLVARGQTLATWEWGTEGLLASWLCAAAHHAPAYRGGLATVSREGLRALGGSPMSERQGEPDTANAETVASMAESVRRQFAADYALALGPFAESTEDSGLQGHFHFALASPDDTAMRTASSGRR
jgi:nicotinamide-nucleotide amidase